MLAELARNVFSLPRPVQTRLAGPPCAADGFALDPQVQLLLRMGKIVPAPPSYALPLAEARRSFDADALLLAGRPRAVGGVTTGVAPGEVPVPLRLYWPPEAPRRGDLPALLFLHGGGFTVGSLTSHDPVCRRLCADLGCLVVAADYRLAPEHPYPAALRDSRAAWEWLVGRAKALGVDRRRIAVAGDSAGGNLAIGVARKAAVPPCALMVLYGGTDSVEVHPSVITFADGFMITRESLEWYVRQYVPPGHDLSDPCLSPLRADDLHVLPPTYVATAGFDPLRDEARAFARSAQAQGAEVVDRCFGSLIHGFLNFTDLKAACAAFDECTAWLHDQLYPARLSVAR
ncbi:MAG: alpha/beta hydrolase [Planctomycetes bacterium]|nr:alpha/beta hydrolase [Planctomycetota bacterium]